VVFLWYCYSVPIKVDDDDDDDEEEDKTISSIAEQVFISKHDDLKVNTCWIQAHI